MKRLTLSVAVFVALAGCFPAKRVSVSPDGSHLVVVGSGNTEGLFLMTPDGKECRRLAQKAACPVFSPDGKRCVFIAPGEPEPAPEPGKAEGSGPGAQGEQAPAAQRKPRERIDYVLMDVASGERKVLASWLQSDEQQTVLAFSHWRPDGKAIALVRLWIHKEAKDATHTELRLVDPADGTSEQLDKAVGLNCAWSPDGGQLAYVTQLTADGTSRLTEASMPGQLHLMTEGDARTVAALVFNPWQGVAWLDDDRVAFGSLMATLPMGTRLGKDLRHGVHVYDAKTDTVAQLFDTGTAEGMSWEFLVPSPDRKRMFYSRKGPGDSDDPALWCYDIAEARGRQVAESIKQQYPFWVGNNRVGWFTRDNILAIATIDREGKVGRPAALDLKALANPPVEKKPEPQDKPAHPPADPAE